MPWAAPVTMATLFSKRFTFPSLSLRLDRLDDRSGRFGDRLGLQVLLETGHTHLAADPGLLVATERSVRAEPDTTVHGEGAGTDPRRHCLRALERARVDRPGQPVRRVVGDPDRVVVAVVRDDDKHRPEDLLLG